MKLFPTKRDLLKKLDIMSGTIYAIEGLITKNLIHRAKIISLKLDNTYDLIVELIKLQDKSSFHFSSIKYGKTNIKITGRITKFTMNEFQFVDATFEALKRNGQPAKVENARAETDHPEMVTAEIVDERTARFTAIEGSISEPTAVLCKVIADADLDADEVREIEVIGSLTITPGEAETLTLTFGEAQDKP